MSSSRISLKDKIASRLSHKNQEKKSNLNGNGPNTLAPGASIVPGITQITTTTTVTQDLNGLPIQGNVIQEELVQQSTVAPLATDLNQNGIPDQLEGKGFGFIESAPATTTSVIDVREAPTIVEFIEKPAVVHEVLKTEEVIQIQPVIERERETLDVYEVVQPMKEREVIPTEIRSVTLPSEIRAVVEDQSAFLAERSIPGEFSTKEVTPTLSQTVENAPIIHETITHRVVEEVQPIIYKEIDRPVLVKETLPIFEKIVEAPHAHHTILPMKDLGIRTTTTDINGDVIQEQYEGGIFQNSGFQGTNRMEKDLNGVDDSLERKMQHTNLNSQTY